MSALNTWEAIKKEASARGPLSEGLVSKALNTWLDSDQGTKLSEDRTCREDFAASLVGAAVVDAMLDKCAEEKALTGPELDFLRELNATAALEDLAHFSHNQNALRRFVP